MLQNDTSVIELTSDSYWYGIKSIGFGLFSSTDDITVVDVAELSALPVQQKPHWSMVQRLGHVMTAMLSYSVQGKHIKQNYFLPIINTVYGKNSYHPMITTEAI